MPFAIGLDVSKKHVDAVILLDEAGHKKRHKRFSNAKGHESSCSLGHNIIA
ncbi:MAG: hypothetical protein R3F37_04510 [Candidatus Competibacteraceae bacterium]